MTAPSHKAFRAARTRPSRPLAQTVSVIVPGHQDLRPCCPSTLPATDCAVAPASAVLRCASIRRSVPVRVDRCTPHQRLCALTLLGRSGPGPGGRLPNPSAACLCRGLGACGLPALAPSKPVSPPAPDSLQGQASAPFGRSGSLVIGRLIAGSRNPAHPPAANETANNQGPHSDVRFSVSDTSSAITRPKAGKRVYTYSKEAAADAAAVLLQV